jgi:hypothetical protein
MTQVLRGQQGFPTGQGRPPAGTADPSAARLLPDAADWQQPDRAEAAIDVARQALARQQRPDDVGGAGESADLVREAEQIEEDVAPGRGTEGDEPPTDESAND